MYALADFSEAISDPSSSQSWSTSCLLLNFLPSLPIVSTIKNLRTSAGQFHCKYETTFKNSQTQ